MDGAGALTQMIQIPTGYLTILRRVHAGLICSPTTPCQYRNDPRLSPRPAVTNRRQNTMTNEYRNLCAEMAEIEEAMNTGNTLISNQGQALDGFSALAAFRDVAVRARIALEAERQGLTDMELLELMPQQMCDNLAAASRALAQQAGTAAGIFRNTLNRDVIDYARIILSHRPQRQ